MSTSRTAEQSAADGAGSLARVVGVAPIGHLRPIETHLDPRLLDFDRVWAAAGTPNHVFAVDPRKLVEVLGPRVTAFAA